jgi:hypothetical protein
MRQLVATKGWIDSASAQEVETSVITMMDERYIAPMEDVAPEPTPVGVNVAPRKKAKHCPYRDLAEASPIVASSNLSRDEAIAQELSTYKSTVVFPSADERFDVLGWWRQQNQLPLLQSVARSILAIPASSAKSESNFSDGGNTVTKLRTALKPSVVNDLLFLRSVHKHTG